MQQAEARRGSILPVLEAFGVRGTLVRLDQWTDGHINQTFLASLEEAGSARRVVVQRINSKVFPDIPGLMDNAIRVSEHAARKLGGMSGLDPADLERGTLRFQRTLEGAPCLPDPSGDAWRIYPCIERARAKRVATSPGEAFEAARAFGIFQSLLSDMPGPRLHETLSGFHDTPGRFSQLDAAERSDSRGRRASAKDELRVMGERRDRAGVLQAAFSDGVFPERIVHNDAKFSNVLLDAQTGKSVCVIDLDTVMPGYALHDFGDLVRSICNPAEEDASDLSTVQVRLPFFQALVEGYLDTAWEMLEEGEIRLLPDAGWALTFEVSLRFLADHLNGDVYFHIRYPGQNLVRARTQLALALRLEEVMPELRSIVQKVMERLARERGPSGTFQSRSVSSEPVQGPSVCAAPG